MNTLKKTHPHFIRCIIPNHDKTGAYLNDQIVIDQLRCNGVLEGIKISRKGYPNRMKFADFLKMYYLLGDGVLKKSAEPKQSCQKIIDQLIREGVFILKDEKETYQNVQLGLSKIFFRVGVLGKIESAREAKMAKLIPTCQAAIRGLIARRVYNASKERESSVRYFIIFILYSFFILFFFVRFLFASFIVFLPFLELSKRLSDNTSTSRTGHGLSSTKRLNQKLLILIMMN